MSTHSSDRPSTPSIEQDVVAAELTLTKAVLANDAVDIAACVTDDWMIVSETGPSEGQALLDLIASGQLTHSAMAIVGTPQVRVLNPATAILTARITNTAHYEGQTFGADEWTTDLYVKREGRWRCAYMHYTPARDG